MLSSPLKKKEGGLKMKLLTKEIEAKLPKLYSQEKVKDPVIIVKFFTPWSNWTWFVIEGEKVDGNWQFFGMVHGLEHEIGYFNLNELESLTGPMGLKIERDKFFGYDHKLNEFRGTKIEINIQSKEWNDLVMIAGERGKKAKSGESNISIVKGEIEKAIGWYIMEEAPKGGGG